MLLLENLFSDTKLPLESQLKAELKTIFFARRIFDGYWPIYVILAARFWREVVTSKIMMCYYDQSTVVLNTSLRCEYC
jgi:hypothetical protein